MIHLGNLRISQMYVKGKRVIAAFFGGNKEPEYTDYLPYIVVSPQEIELTGDDNIVQIMSNTDWEIN